MQILRTPAERFADIPDYPFAEHWFEVDLGEGLTARQHYVDEGPRDAPVAKKTSAASVKVEISAAARKMNAGAAADIAQENNQFDLQTYTQQLKDQQLDQALDTTIDT